MSWGIAQVAVKGEESHNLPRQRWKLGSRPPFSNSGTITAGSCTDGATMDEKTKFLDISATRTSSLRKGRIHILLTALLIFSVLTASGTGLYRVSSKANERKHRGEALDLAAQTADWFSKELDLAILPLFSIAQFALELEEFATLPSRIGLPGQPGALPYITTEDGFNNTHRNTTGVCDEPKLFAQYVKIAAAIKKNSKMGAILNNIQLAPFGVLCLLYPLNNTEDYDNGQFLDRTKGMLGFAESDLRLE
jgi:hypothetical protein